MCNKQFLIKLARKAISEVNFEDFKSKTEPAHKRTILFTIADLWSKLWCPSMDERIKKCGI